MKNKKVMPIKLSADDLRERKRFVQEVLEPSNGAGRGRNVKDVGPKLKRYWSFQRNIKKHTKYEMMLAFLEAKKEVELPADPMMLHDELSGICRILAMPDDAAAIKQEQGEVLTNGRR